MDIGSRIKLERERLGMTQAEMATAGGVQKVAQSNYERNVRKPNAGYLQAIAFAGADVLFILTNQRSMRLQNSALQ